MNFQRGKQTVDVISLSFERVYEGLMTVDSLCNCDFSKYNILGLFVVTVDKINVEVWHQRRGLLYHVLTPSGIHVQEVDGISTLSGQGAPTLWMKSNRSKVCVARLAYKGIYIASIYQIVLLCY